MSISHHQPFGAKTCILATIDGNIKLMPLVNHPDTLIILDDDGFDNSVVMSEDSIFTTDDVQGDVLALKFESVEDLDFLMSKLAEIKMRMLGHPTPTISHEWRGYDEDKEVIESLLDRPLDVEGDSDENELRALLLPDGTVMTHGDTFVIIVATGTWCVVDASGNRKAFYQAEKAQK